MCLSVTPATPSLYQSVKKLNLYIPKNNMHMYHITNNNVYK